MQYDSLEGCKDGVPALSAGRHDPDAQPRDIFSIFCSIDHAREASLCPGRLRDVTGTA